MNKTYFKIGSFGHLNCKRTKTNKKLQFESYVSRCALALSHLVSTLNVMNGLYSPGFLVFNSTVVDIPKDLDQCHFVFVFQFLLVAHTFVSLSSNHKSKTQNYMLKTNLNHRCMSGYVADRASSLERECHGFDPHSGHIRNLYFSICMK